jgi:hypothetical protein
MTIALGSLEGIVPLSSPLRFVLVAPAGWVNQQQREVIDYLQEENRALREQLGPRRLQFMDAQRRRLAAKAKTLGRHPLRDIATIVTPAFLARFGRSMLEVRYADTLPCIRGSAMGFELCCDVILTRDIVEQGLRARDVGTLVGRHVAPAVAEEGYSIEFFDMTGNRLAVVTVPASALRLPKRVDRPAARALSVSSELRGLLDAARSQPSSCLNHEAIWFKSRASAGHETQSSIGRLRVCITCAVLGSCADRADRENQFSE